MPKKETVSHCQSKETSILWSHNEETRKLSGARRRGRPRKAWTDNIKMWTGLSVEESIRMTEDRDKWRKYVHGVANPRTMTAEEQNRTVRWIFCHRFFMKQEYILWNVYLPNAKNLKFKPVRVSKQIAYCRQIYLLYVQIPHIRGIRSQTRVTSI